MEYTIIERRGDGSFVIEKDVPGIGLSPFHVVPDLYPELWASVCAQEGLDPVAQAEIYARSKP